MSVENRELLKNQLEQQARLFTTETNDTKLVTSILATCSALLRAAGKAMPEDLTRENFSSVYAGYLGVANRVKIFYRENPEQFDEQQSALLKDLTDSLEEAEQAKKTVDEKISQAGKAFEVAREDAAKKRSTLESLQREKISQDHEKTQAEQALKKVRAEIQKLKEETEKAKRQTENFQPDMEKLMAEAAAAKDSYEELTAYFSEVKKIQGAMGDDGYVDMKSFTEALKEMNVQSTELMARYDSFLKNISTDLDNLQKKIDVRRKGGVTA